MMPLQYFLSRSKFLESYSKKRILPILAEPVGHFSSLAFARMPSVEARGGMATDDRGVARRAKTGLPRHSFATAGGFGGVPLGFATDAPRGSAGSFTFRISHGSLRRCRNLED